MSHRRLIPLAAVAALTLTQAAIADPDVDAAGCKDFFVSRIAGYVLGDCQQLDFDSFVFDEGGDNATTVEGKIVHNTYSQPDGATQHSELFVQNNYMNALTAGGWTIVATMKSNSSLQLTVEGHTDNVGSAQSNQALSQSRAQAVVAAVTGTGIPASRLTAVGYGQSKPVADNSTDAGRAQNRRVDLVKK